MSVREKVERKGRERGGGSEEERRVGRERQREECGKRERKG